MADGAAAAALLLIAAGAVAWAAHRSQRRLAAEHRAIVRGAQRMPLHGARVWRPEPQLIPACDRPGCDHPNAPAAYVVVLAGHPDCGPVLMCPGCLAATAGHGHKAVCPECGRAAPVADYQGRDYRLTSQARPATTPPAVALAVLGDAQEPIR